MTTPPPYLRGLSATERTALEACGCRFAADTDVRLGFSEPLDTSRFRNTGLEGRIVFHDQPALVADSRLTHVDLYGNVEISGSELSIVGNAGCGHRHPFSVRVTDSTVRNCDMAEGALIERSMVDGYRIGREVHVSDVRSMVYDTDRACHRVNTLSETGGFTVTARPGLTVEQAEAEAYGLTPAADYAPGSGSVGDYAEIIGASRLDGVIVAERATVGCNVIAVNTVVDSDARLSDGSMVYDSYVGRGCVLAKGFTAHDSLFFDNCTMECGEAAAVFAGPHAVSCHKSTLLIGCRCSFFNAGSGTNMSNHAYRLGPFHHGTLLRGCKTASNAYILWPATFGAFSLIIGNHKHNPDTTDLPFSYVIEDCGKLTIMPGMVLRGVGLMRDVEKWPKRDRRHEAEPIDCRHLTPEVVDAMMRGLKLLESIDTDTRWQGYTLSAGAARRGAEAYRLALTAHFLTPLVRGGESDPRFAEWTGKNADELSDAERLDAIAAWRDAELRLLRFARTDALKDFVPSTRPSIGTPDTHPFIAMIDALSAEVTDMAEVATRLLTKE